MLFADVSGFTAMSEQLDHETVNHVMRACWAELDQVVLAFGGTVDKHIGDALMATFGAQVAHEDDPLRAVQAGLALQRQLEAFSARLEAATGLGLRMRCGIAMGEVTVDQVAESTGELSVIGPAVNLASRLEHECTVGSVFVNGDVHRATEWIIEYRDIAPRPIRGIAGLVPIYEALREREAAQRRPDRVNVAASHGLIGRGTEQAVFRAALEEVKEGRGRVLALVGEAGIGKTALATALRATVLAAGVRWVGARCLSYTETQPYALMREAVRDLLGVNSETGATTVRERLAATLAFQGTSERGQEAPAPDADQAALTLSDRQALLAHLLLAEEGDGVSGEAGDFVHTLEPQTRRRLTVQAIGDLFVTHATRGPLVLSLEDLHWCDVQSLEVAAAIAHGMTQAQLLLLVQARPGAEPDWLSLPHAQTLHLAPFTRQETLVLLETVWREGADHDSGAVGNAGAATAHLDELAARLHEASRGNPYFLVEVLSLIEQGRPAPANEPSPRPDSALPSQLPSTVRRLLLARMDTLDPLPRLVLEEASVAGQTFEQVLVEDISEQPQAVRPSLHVLVEREFVRPVIGDGTAPQHRTMIPDIGPAPVRSGDRWYEFQHSLLRETAYETLARHRRRRYHGRVAAFLERQSNVTQDAGALGLLAYHFNQSDEDERAVHYALLAAHDAAAQYANEAALFWYDRAAEALDRLERGGLGIFIDPRGQPVREGEAGAVTGSTDHGEMWVRLLADRAGVEATLGDYAAAREHLERALARCELAPQDRAPSAANILLRHIPGLCYRLARVGEALGDYGSALRWVDRGLAHQGATWDADSVTLANPPSDLDTSHAVRLCVGAGLVYLRLARYNDAGLWARRAMELAGGVAGAGGGAEGFALAQDIAQAYNLLGLVARHQGRAKEAEQYCRESAARYEAIGDLVGAEKALNNLAVALKAQGAMAEALALFRRSQGLAQRVGDPIRQAAALTNMGEIHTLQGNLGEARQGYEAALAVFERHGQQNAAAICRMNLAHTYLALEDGSTALALARAAQEEFARIGAATYVPEALRYEALALLLLGRPAEATEAAAAALERARELGRRLEEGQALRVLGQVRAALGDPENVQEANRLFEASRTTLAELNARYELGLTLLEHARVLLAGVADFPDKDRAHNHHAEAARLCAQAADVFQQAGATRDLAASEALQQALLEGRPGSS